MRPTLTRSLPRRAPAAQRQARMRRPGSGRSLRTFAPARRPPLADLELAVGAHECRAVAQPLAALPARPDCPRQRCGRCFAAARPARLEQEAATTPERRLGRPRLGAASPAGTGRGRSLCRKARGPGGTHRREPRRDGRSSASQLLRGPVRSPRAARRQQASPCVGRGAIISRAAGGQSCAASNPQRRRTCHVVGRASRSRWGASACPRRRPPPLDPLPSAPHCVG